MRHRFVLLAAFAALSLTSCRAPGVGLGAKGPGVDDTGCAYEVPAPPTGPGSVAQTATAEGGQRASNQPNQADPGARGIHTTWNRGAGPNADSSTTTESRSQAGAPSVNQGLILPTSADVGGGASSVKEAAANVAMLREALKMAYATNAPNVDAIFRQLSEAQLALAAAEQGARPQITYNLQGAVSNQTVANGSKSGGGDNADTVATPGSRAVRAPGAPAVLAPVPPEAPAVAPAPAPAPEPGMAP